MFSRFALRLEYDGTAYAGSQLQKDQPTIQGAVESALKQISGNDLIVDFAGRTDAGVHARGQVAAFTTEQQHDAATWLRALNAVLPDDIAVVSATSVAIDFDPRRNATRRWYRYSVLCRPGRSALLRTTAWHVPSPLDLEAMQTAAREFLGRHDFAAFCGSLEPGRTTTRTIFASCLSSRAEIVRFDVVGDAFLPQQIRRMTGALVRVGQERMSVEELRSTLEEAVPRSSPHVAPPHGLCLMNVEYEGMDLGVTSHENI